MDTLTQSEAAAFVGEDVQNIVKEIVESVLGKKQYSHGDLSDWSIRVLEGCLKRLTQLNKPFKYVVTCVIMQRNGAGLHSASSCLWDAQSDGSFSYRWENQSMHAVVSVFGLAI